MTPPFYYPMDQAGVLAFYRTLGRRSPIPILLYNIPQFTKVVADTGDFESAIFCGLANFRLTTFTTKLIDLR